MEGVISIPLFFGALLNGNYTVYLRNIFQNLDLIDCSVCNSSLPSF